MMQPGGRTLSAPAVSVMEAIREDLRLRVGSKAWQDCFEQRTRFEVRANELIVTVANAFLERWLQKQFREDLAAVAREHVGPNATLRFALALDSPAAAADVQDERTVGLETAALETVALKLETVPGRTEPPRSTVGRTAARTVATRGEPNKSEAPTRRRFADLSEFVSGPGSQLAMTAIARLTQQLGSAVNPLVLYGPVGNGKTHLLEGIYREVRRRAPALSVLYLTAEAFTNCFTEALRDHTLPAFRQKFRTVHVLIVDDIDFLDGKKVVQEEFVHTFKQLHSQGRQIVLAGDRHPRLFTKMSEELITRLLSGMVCRLELPDLPTREAIAARKATAMGADFPTEVLKYVAERFPRSVRELEGALHCLRTWQEMTHKPTTLSAARQILADLERDCVRPVRLPDVERVVCQAFGLEPAELRSSRRTKALAQPRMVAMYLARKHTPAAYKEIGEFFGGRNHSTVISAERKIGAWIGSEEPVRVASQTLRFAELVGSLEQQLLVG